MRVIASPPSSSLTVAPFLSPPLLSLSLLPSLSQAIDKITLRSRHAHALAGLLTRINFYERCGALDEALGGLQLGSAHTHFERERERDAAVTGEGLEGAGASSYSASDTLVGYLRQL